MQRRTLLSLSAGLALPALPLPGRAADAVKELRLDYASYSPTSLVLKKFGWLDDELKRADIEHVALQHADGRAALEQGRVDAWAGLDPLMAAAELNTGARLLYRNLAFNTYGFLNVREDFLARQPELVKRVISQYERARLWTLANLTEAARILADEAKVSLEVALLQLKLRTDLSNPQPGTEHVAALQAAAPILLDEALVRPGTDLKKTVAELVDTRFAQGLIQRA